MGIVGLFSSSIANESPIVWEKMEGKKGKKKEVEKKKKFEIFTIN
jgi:hypothetical protein